LKKSLSALFKSTTSLAPHDQRNSNWTEKEKSEDVFIDTFGDAKLKVQMKMIDLTVEDLKILKAIQPLVIEHIDEEYQKNFNLNDTDFANSQLDFIFKTNSDSEIIKSSILIKDDRIIYMDVSMLSDFLKYNTNIIVRHAITILTRWCCVGILKSFLRQQNPY